MQDHVFSAQRALGEAEEENRELKRQLDDRAAFEALAADMDFTLDGNFYVRKSEREKGLIPYCPHCWTKNEKLGHMIPTSPGLYLCREHEAYFETEEYKARKASEAATRVQKATRPRSPWG